MIYRQSGDLVHVRLTTGEDPFAQLKEVCSSIGARTAVVVSAIGMLKEVEIGYFKGKGQYLSHQMDGPFELVTLNGTVVEHEGEFYPHLHVALAGEDHSLIGGHLGKATVHVTNEITLRVSEARIGRRTEEETGLMGMYFPQ